MNEWLEREGGGIDQNLRMLVSSRDDWRVETYTVSQAESDASRVRVVINPMDHYVPPDTYTRLVRGRTIVMANTPLEVRTHADFVQRATGHVLINGLGL